MIRVVLVGRVSIVAVVLVVAGCDSGSSGSAGGTVTTSAETSGVEESVVSSTVGSVDSTVASATTLSPEQRRALELRVGLDEQVTRYEALSEEMDLARAAWVAVDRHVWEARGKAAELPDYEGGGEWLTRKTDFLSRADLLTLLVMQAIGPQRDLAGNPVEGAPFSTGGVLNDVPAGWNASVKGVSDAIDAGDLSAAQTLLDALTADVDEFESKVTIRDQDGSDPESVPVQAQVLQSQATATAQSFLDAVAAENAARQKANNNNAGGGNSGGSSGGSGSSGGGSGGGGSSGGGSGGGGGSSGGGSGGGGDTPPNGTLGDGTGRI